MNSNGPRAMPGSSNAGGSTQGVGRAPSGTSSPGRSRSSLRDALRRFLLVVGWIVTAILGVAVGLLIAALFVFGLMHWAALLLAAIVWAALLLLLIPAARRYGLGRGMLTASTGFFLVFALTIFALLWSVGSNFHLAEISRRLLSDKQSNDVVAFVDVNLVPMDTERIVAHQTVIVRGGRIEDLGPADSEAVPPEAVRVDGQGKYLMPGLTDMHAHVVINLDDPLLFLANGVTSVRSMSSYAPTLGGLIPNLPYRSHVDLRDKVARGDLVGPALFLEPGPIEDKASPFLRGYDKITALAAPLYRVVSTPEEAVQRVDEVRQEGFQNVKVYSYLRNDEYEAVASAAEQRGLKIIGHVPRGVRVEDALVSGRWRTIEHLSGYMHPCGGLKIPAGQLGRYAQLTAESGVWNVPTLVAFANVPPPEPPEFRAAMEKQPSVPYVSPWMREIWKGEYRPFDKICAETTPVRYPRENLPQMQALVHALNDAGAGILLGSDAGAPYVAPGFGLHDELRLLVEAGLSPYEALRAGTYNAASALGTLDQMGTIAQGKRADLILLDANPLENIANVTASEHRGGVMAGGRWFEAAELQGALQELASHYR